MIPDHLIGSMVALTPAEGIAAIRRRLDDGGEAGDLATSDVRALLAALDDAERVARGAAWALAELRSWVAMLRGRVEAAVADEREACALACDAIANDPRSRIEEARGADDCAVAIRARGA